MSGAPVALLILLAVVVLVFGAVLSAGEAALTRMTRAAAEDLVQDERRGAGRVLTLASRRAQVLGSVTSIRVAVDMLAAVLLTLAVSGILSRWWQVLAVAVVLNVVLLGLVVGFSPRSGAAIPMPCFWFWRASCSGSTPWAPRGAGSSPAGGVRRP